MHATEKYPAVAQKNLKHIILSEVVFQEECCMILFYEILKNSKL